MSRPVIAIGTCVELPEPDVDEDLLNEALRARDLEPVLIPWDGEHASWSEFAAVVLRSTWNYLDDPVRFERWLEAAERGSQLWNRLDIARWNIDKRYLLELTERGVPVLPTKWLERGTRAQVAEILDETGWRDIVIKPAISAGSFGTKRFSSDEIADAQAFLEEGLSERDQLVQEYQASVETAGEQAIVIIDGEVTHVVRKNPRFSGDDESVSEAREPTDDERKFAVKALEASEPSIGSWRELLYGRVDVIPDAKGNLLLAELELLEPSLFFLQAPHALERFADAIARRVRA